MTKDQMLEQVSQRIVEKNYDTIQKRLKMQCMQIKNLYLL